MDEFLDAARNLKREGRMLAVAYMNAESINDFVACVQDCERHATHKKDFVGRLIESDLTDEQKTAVLRSLC